MLNTTIKAVTVAAMLAGSAVGAYAADYKLRATANSNENDEDYDGLVVFKNYVEQASNGRARGERQEARERDCRDTHRRRLRGGRPRRNRGGLK